MEQLGSTAVCDSIFIDIHIYEGPDLTSHTILSDGFAIVGQTSAGSFERYGLISSVEVYVTMCFFIHVPRRSLLVFRWDGV